MPTQTCNRLFHMLQSRCTGTGDTRDGHVIDKTGTAVEHARQTRVVSGRRGQADEIQTGSLRRVAQFFVVLWRHVDHDQAVNASLFGFGNEAIDAEFVDRVEIAHQHQRRVAVAFAKLANHLQGFR